MTTAGNGFSALVAFSRRQNNGPAGSFYLFCGFSSFESLLIAERAKQGLHAAPSKGDNRRRRAVVSQSTDEQSLAMVEQALTWRKAAAGLCIISRAQRAAFNRCTGFGGCMERADAKNGRTQGRTMAHRAPRRMVKRQHISQRNRLTPVSLNIKDQSKQKKS